MEAIYIKYNIDKTYLSPYQYKLLELVTENIDFTKNYKSNRKVKFSDNSQIDFFNFKTQYSKIFTELIIKINDAG